MIKRILPIILLAAGLQAGWGFALLGPTGNGGDSWQTAVIGYNLAYADGSTPGGAVYLGDIGGPKNIGEGYRRNTPMVYYAYDANFLGFFGADGASAADGAFAIMNNLTNVSSYSTDLSEFPDQSLHFNYQAESLFLTDVKSVTLHLLVETMGLAQPERYTWTLSERLLQPGGKCPGDMIYQVLQRNFAISPTGPTQTLYSPYVNDVLYTYGIQEFCAGNPPLAFTVPYSVDPIAQEYTAVAANNSDGSGNFGGGFSIGGGLQIGSYYAGLTRDDVAGLRYLYRSNNIVTEDPAAGSLLLTTNFPSPQQVQTLSYGLFISQLTNDPATLAGLYPNLDIVSSSTNFGLTNITILIPTFTNYPGTTVTNFEPPILITNVDLTLFLSQALTNAPAALQALYPQLEILSSSIPYYTNIMVPILQTYLTNAGIGSPANNPPIVKTVTNGFAPNIFPIYSYVFGNLFTNSFHSNSTVSFQTITITNVIGAPAGSIVTNIVTKTKTITNSPSGDIFIIPTNWCGFFTLQKIYNQKIPSFTNTLKALPLTNTLGSASFTENVIYYFTNRIWVVEPGVCEPTLIFETNVVNLVTTNYQYSFGNLYTNLPTMQFSNSLVTVIITNVGPCSNGMVGTLCTNVITQTVTQTNVPTGDFFIIPAAWTCGFKIVSVVATNQIGFTNTINTAVPTNVVDIGQQYTITTISLFTNHTLLIQPYICQTTTNSPALRAGIERVQFVRANFDALIGQYFQPITNIYSMTALNNTNGKSTIEYYQRVIAQPDILMSADDNIAPNTFVGTVMRDINFDTANVLPGLAGPGVINSPVTFFYNKIGSAFFNGSLNDNPGASFLSEFTQIPAVAWASFDGSTNPPEVYPNGNSITTLENEILVQISPTSLPDGTNNTPYPAVTITMTGGAYTPPLTFAAANLPSGMTISSGGVISGTPTQSGAFDVTIVVTDSQGRTVTWDYPLNIQ